MNDPKYADYKSLKEIDVLCYIVKMFLTQNNVASKSRKKSFLVKDFLFYNFRVFLMLMVLRL